MCCSVWFVPGRRVTVPPADAQKENSVAAVSASDYTGDNGTLLFVCCTSDCVY